MSEVHPTVAPRRFELAASHRGRRWRGTLVAGIAAASLGALVAGASGCRRRPSARVLSAEFLDDTPDGKVQQGETIVLRLDRPLPPGLAPQTVQVTSLPRASWANRVYRGVEPDLLEVRLLSGRPAFALDGIHGRDPGATGLVVDLGDGVSQVVDLQRARCVPVLERAVWEDVAIGVGGVPGPGNGVVDRGDRIRLVFDQPVRLAPQAEGRPLQVPRDILLSRDSLDRLDDGEEPSVLVPGEAENEVAIRLGSGPVLNIRGELPDDPERVDRFSPDSPSGVALNGTEILPFPWVTGCRGGPGAASRHEVDLEFPEGFPQPLARADSRLPPPGPREDCTVTPLAGSYAVVAGGRSVGTGEPLSAVLLYSPFHRRFASAAFVEASLPHGVYDHSATLLSRADSTAADLGDVVVIVGGTDGNEAHGDITVVGIDARGAFTARTLEAKLAVPRFRHAAVAVGPHHVLIDGGRTIAADGTVSLVGCAELLEIRLDGPDGEPRLGRHTLFATLAREDHTLTRLVRGPRGEAWVLAYGGYGRNTLRESVASGPAFGAEVLPADVESTWFPPEEGSVLIAPSLIDAFRPERSIASLPHDIRLSFPRRRHRAVGLGEDLERPPVEATTVIVLGGTLAHPIHDFSGPITALWEIPPAALPSLRRRPEPSDALGAVRFELDPEFPRESRLVAVPHPWPEPDRLPVRLRPSATFVPGLGIVVAGGESASAPGESEPLASLEVYLAQEERLAVLATGLRAPRGRHGAFLVRDGDRRSLLLVGGRTRGATAGDVEEVPLPPAGP